METKSIYTKLLEVQKEVAPIKKTEDNPFFKSKYFDVNAILAALKPILSAHGLVLTQAFAIVTGGSQNVLETIVADADTGEKVTSHIYLPEAPDPQKFGSAVTYYRRYALQSLFALEAEDDDANFAAAPVRPSQRVPQRQSSGKTPTTTDTAMLDEVEWQLKLESVGNTAELKTVWDSLPVEARNALGEVKDKLKKQFAKADK